MEKEKAKNYDQLLFLMLFRSLLFPPWERLLMLTHAVKLTFTVGFESEASRRAR